MSELQGDNNIIMKIERWLGISLIWVVGICLWAGCGQENEKIEVGSKEVKNEKVALSQKKVEQEIPRNEELQTAKEIEVKQTRKEIKSNLSVKDKRKIEKKVLKIVDRLEEFYLLFLAIEKNMGKIDEKQDDVDKMIEELVELREVSIPILIKIIKNKREHYRFRLPLIGIIANNMKDRRLVKVLREIIEDSKEGIIMRNNAASVLKESFNEVPPEIILSDKDIKNIEKEVKRVIDNIERKCNMTDDMTAVDWIVGMETDELASIGSSGLPFMIKAIKDKKRHWYCRDVVLQVIPGLGNFVLREDGTFKSIDDRIIELLMELIDDESDIKIIRVKAMCSLAKYIEQDEKIFKKIFSIIETEKDMYIRSDVIRDLAKIEKIIDPLLELFKKDENIEIKASAILSLCGVGIQTGDKRITDLFLEILKAEKLEPEIYIPVVYGLGRLKDKRAVEPLIEDFEKGSLEAAEALGNLGKMMEEKEKDRIMNVLIKSLKPEDPQSLINRWAAWALAEIGDMRAVKPLEDVLRDPKYEQDQRVMAAALKKLTGKDYKY